MARQMAEADTLAKKTGLHARAYQQQAKRTVSPTKPLLTLKEPSDLVQAIVYSEIIGPPRALRPHGDAGLFLP